MWSQQRFAVVMLALVTALPGCDQARALLEHPSSSTPTSAIVLPSAPPTELLTLQVAGERELGPIARALGATIEDLVRDNAVEPSQPLHDGQTLQVRTRPSVLQAYIDARRARAEAAERRQREAELAKAAAAAERARQRIRERREARDAARKAARERAAAKRAKAASASRAGHAVAR